RRPRLPLARRAPGAAPPADQDQGGLAQARARLGSRPPPLGGRAHDLLASPVPTPARALRAPRRHPPSAAHDRLLPDLLQAASGRRDILKGALRAKTITRRVGHVQPSALRAPGRLTRVMQRWATGMEELRAPSMTTGTEPRHAR